MIAERKLPEDILNPLVQYQRDGERDPRPDAPKYQLRIKLTHTHQISELNDYLSTTLQGSFSQMSLTGTKQSALSALNIYFHHRAKSTRECTNLVSVGTDKIWRLPAVGEGRLAGDLGDLGLGLYAPEGFISSVRPANNRLLLNVNIKHGAFYRWGPLTKLKEAHVPDLLSATDDDWGKFANWLERFLKGVRITTTFKRKEEVDAGATSPRSRRICGLARHFGKNWERDRLLYVKEFGSGPNDVNFVEANGKYISVAEFFNRGEFHNVCSN